MADDSLVEGIAAGTIPTREGPRGLQYRHPETRRWRKVPAGLEQALHRQRANQPIALPPLLKARKGDLDALSFLSQQGVELLDDGDVKVSRDALLQIRKERLRRVALSSVPSTPRYLTREAGGVGVQRGYGRVHQVTNQALRQIRQRSAIFMLIHRARQYQIRHMSRPWGGGPNDIGYRVVHKDFRERGKVPPDGFERFIRQFSAILEHPAPQYGVNTLGELLGPLAEDMHTINRPACEVLRSLYDPERVVGFRWVDGDLIWPTMVWLEKWKRDHPEWHGRYDPSELSSDQELELASAALDIDLFAGRECVVREGVLESVLPPGKMIVAPMTTRTDVRYAGYPPSHVEDALEFGVAFMNTWDFNTSLWTRGMLAEFALGLVGNMSGEDVDAFTDMFRESTQGVNRAWQPPVIPLPDKGTIQKIDLKPLPKDMGFAEFMSLQLSGACAIYRMDPSSINGKPWDGGSGPSLNAPNRQIEIATAKEEGLQGDLLHLTEQILNPLARRCHPDLRVVWEFGDQDPLVIAQIDEARTRVASTRNDVRLARGENPMGFHLDEEERYRLEQEDPESEDLKRHHKNPWNWPTDPSFLQAMSQQQQAEMMEQGGMSGMDDGEEAGAGDVDDADEDFDDEDDFDFDEWLAGFEGPDSEGGEPGSGGSMEKGRHLPTRPRRGRVTVAVFDR